MPCSVMLRSSTLSPRTIRDLMIKRFAVLATAATLLPSFTATAIASGRSLRHRYSAVRARPASNTPDQVIEWNQELQKVLVAPGGSARFDSSHAHAGDRPNRRVRRGHRHCRRRRTASRRPACPSGTSAEAAAAAARTTLDALLPSQQPTIDAFFQSSLTQIGPGKRVDHGIRFRDRGGSGGVGRQVQR
jgi:hypothetical protein